MDRYDRGRAVGAGLFSSVVEATVKSTGQLVALKVVDVDAERPPHDCRREAHILKQLNAKQCPHVVRLIDTFEYTRFDTERVLVLEYLPYSLDSVVKANCKAQYPTGWRNALSESRALNIIQDVAAALAFVHAEGIIHRDVKSDNILFSTLDGSPVLVDFGISWEQPDNGGKEAELAKITDVSTASYKAPELLFSLTRYSAAIDIWSLGCVACLLFSAEGTAPFTPYRGDIALFASQADALGAPSLDIWPEMIGNSSFGSMDLSSVQTPADPWIHLAPNASGDIRTKLLAQCLQFESTHRPKAPGIVSIINNLKN